jgi:hypothetical protein
MMVVMTMMVMGLRKCGSRNHQDHGKQQSLFHEQHHNNNAAARMAPRVTLGLLAYLNDVRTGQEKSSRAVVTGVRARRVP